MGAKSKWDEAVGAKVRIGARSKKREKKRH